MQHVFGRSIVFSFNPLAGDEDCAAHSLTSARIYADRPTLLQKQNLTSGHLGSPVTSWAAGEQGEYRITFPFLTDPSPDSDEDYEKFYVVANFKLEAGADDVFIDEVIHVFRPDALTSRFRVIPQDVYSRESKIETVRPRANFVDEKIENAILEVDRVLRAKGYSRKRTFKRERMNEAVALLATADSCADLAGEGNQFWMAKGEMWRKRYEIAVDSIPLGYDVDGDDDPDEGEQTFSGAVPLLR